MLGGGGGGGDVGGRRMDPCNGIHVSSNPVESSNTFSHLLDGSYQSRISLVVWDTLQTSPSRCVISCYLYNAALVLALECTIISNK